MKKHEQLREKIKEIRLKYEKVIYNLEDDKEEDEGNGNMGPGHYYPDLSPEERDMKIELIKEFIQHLVTLGSEGESELKHYHHRRCFILFIISFLELSFILPILLHLFCRRWCRS